MAEYDGSIRIGTGIDTKGFDEDGERLKEKSKKLASDLSSTMSKSSAGVKVKIDSKSAKKELESVYNDLEKEEKRIEELAKRAVERARNQENKISTEPVAEDSRPYTPGYSQDVINFVEEQSTKLQIADEHWNQLRIDVEEYSKDLKELQSQGKFFGDEEYDKVYLAWKNATDAVKAYQAELNKQTEAGRAKIAEQEAKAAEKKEAAEAKLAAKEAERQAKEEARINVLQAKEEAKRVKEIAAIQAQEQEEQRLDQIRVNAVATNEQIIQKVERIKQLEQEIADLKRAGISEGYSDYGNRLKELSALKADVRDYNNSLTELPEKFSIMRNAAQKAFNAIHSGLLKVQSFTKKVFSTMFNSAKKAFSAITDSSKKSNVSLSGGFKTILKYAFGISSIYTLFNKVRAGIAQGFTNLMGYSNDFANSIQNIKNSMSTLGNQIAAAFAPIVQAVIPWLNQLISALTTAMSYLAQFIAMLGGKSTFLRAKKIQDAYNKSLGNTAKAADKAEGALARFDDLDVWKKQEEVAAGGGGVIGTLPEDMFEEVPIDSEFKNLFDWLKKMWENSDFYELGKAIGEWLKNALDSIPWDEIKEKARSIGESLASLINGFIEVAGLGYSIGTALVQVLNTAFEFLNAYVHELHWISVGKFIADTLNGAFENIDWELIKDTFVTGFTGLARAINSFIYNFHWDNISDSISNLVNILSESIYTFFAIINFDKLGHELGNQLMETIRKIDWREVGRAIGEVIQSAFDFVKGFVSQLELKDVAQAIIDALGGFFESVDAVDLATVVLGVIAAQIVIKAAGFAFSAAATGILNGIASAMSTGLSGFGTIARLIVSGIVGTLSTLGSMGASMAKGILDIIKIGLSTTKTALVDVGSLLLSGIAEGIAGAGGVSGLLTADLGTLLSSGSAATTGVTIGAMLLGGIAGVLGGGALGKLLDNYILAPLMDFDEELSEEYKNFKWFGEDGALARMKESFTDGSWKAALELWGQDIYNGLVALGEDEAAWLESIKESLVEWWENLKETVAEKWEDMKESISETWEDIKTTAMEKWEDIKGKLSEKWDNIKTNLETFKANVSPIWTGLWDTFKSKVDNIVETVKKVIGDFFEWVSEKVSAILAMISSVSAKVSALGGGVGSTLGGAISSGTAMVTANIPALASGAVIRGGNPFMAILGDQPAGQTNIEAPTSTIEQSLENVLNRRGYGNMSSGSFSPVIALNVNGEEFARLTLNDIFQEAARQGYDVDLLGYT